MAISMEKSLGSPPRNTRKFWFVTHNLLRLLAIAATLAAACVLVTNKQTADVYGIQVDARWSYSPAFKFFAFANFVASGFSFVSLLLALVALAKTASNRMHYFYLFLHDLIISVLLMAACAAATAIAYVGKYGYMHTGWMPICDHFGKFCDRVLAAAVLSYIGLILYLVLTIVSAKESRQTCA